MDFVPAEEFEQVIYEMRKDLRRKDDEIRKKNEEIELLKKEIADYKNSVKK
jgi:peptidoglycan hydrolase CwlO-like protein